MYFVRARSRGETKCRWKQLPEAARRLLCKAIAIGLFGACSGKQSQSPTPGPPGTSPGRGPRARPWVLARPKRFRRPQVLRLFFFQTWYPQFPPYCGQGRFVTPMGRAVGGLDQFADLLKTQSAPNSGNHHFALQGIKALQNRHGRRGVQGIARRWLEPGTRGARPLAIRAIYAAGRPATRLSPCCEPLDIAKAQVPWERPLAGQVPQMPLGPHLPGSCTIAGRKVPNDRRADPAAGPAVRGPAARSGWRSCGPQYENACQKGLSRKKCGKSRHLMGVEVALPPQGRQYNCRPNIGTILSNCRPNGRTISRTLNLSASKPSHEARKMIFYSI